jgi:hypothetical protein
VLAIILVVAFFISQNKNNNSSLNENTMKKEINDKNLKEAYFA